MADAVDLEACCRAVRDELSGCADEIVALTQRLVRIPSVNPKFLADPALNREADVQDVVESELASLGFETRRSFPLPGRPNVVARAGGTDARSLALCGHVDVVPQGDPGQWSVEPFSATVRGDRILGRGAGDMKGGLAAGLVACRALRRLRLPLAGRLEFHSVVDEEAGGFGAMAAAGGAAGLSAVLVLESTGGVIRPWAGGLEWVRVTVRGLSGHSARRFASIYPTDEVAHAGVPVRSVNAIELGAKVLSCLRDLEALWGRTRRFPGLPPGMNTISPGALVAGAGTGPDGLPLVLSNPAIVPDLCVLDFDLKFLPHERSEDIRREFEAALAAMAAADPWLRDHPPEVRWGLADLHFPPVNTPADHPLLEALSRAVASGGRVPEVGGMLGVTDAAHYAERGIAGVVFGPTSASAHGPDESVSIPSLVSAAQVVAETVIRYCGLRQDGRTDGVPEMAPRSAGPGGVGRQPDASRP